MGRTCTSGRYIDTLFLQCMPQYLEVSTDAPMPIPMQKIWNTFINCPASDDAESCASPMLLSMIVSMRFMPTVIKDCSEIGTAILAISL